MSYTKDNRQTMQYMLHSAIYDVCFSPCGSFLAAANKFGDVALFSLTAALSPNVQDEAKCPVYTFNVYKNAGIYCLTSTDTELICSGEGDIQAYRWSDIIAKSPKVTWALSIPQKGVFSHPEINSCVIDSNSDKGTLYAGAGDNNIYAWDIESGEYKSCLSGHTDYIHKICTKDNGQGLVSVSEDGTARIWDLRANEICHIVKPYEHEMCARLDLGKWLQCLALDEDNYWLVLGGGPTMSAWHLNTLTPTVTFDTPGVSQTVALFYEDKIFSAGNSNILNHWSLTGDHKMAVPISPTAVYSIGINDTSKSNKVMAIAGSSGYVDICTNFGYRAFSLSFSHLSP
ncbi:hypothetical protein RRG08_011535 [Elysia crispata]|uniref:THO complex subunit 6 n=1 Tax=Elysia crispata TaxID=231223 RepID=A0AAE1AS45_9GAST|nr:hypothetical protein RRG08_011535 [Elysia crispata]